MINLMEQAVISMVEGSGRKQWKMDREIALLCSGLGRVSRGYERYTQDLFREAGKQIPMVLFKGEGSRRDREVSLGGWHRDGRIAVGLEHVWKDRFFWETASFALLAWPRLLRDRFQLIHYSDPALNSIFFRLERWSNRAPRRLFSHGLNMDPEHCLRCHHLHQVSLEAYERALDFGVPKDRMTLLPHGVDTSRFQPADTHARLELRQRYNVGLDSVTVLCVAALNRGHKRVDRLVHAMAALRGDYHLILCGKIEDQTIIDEARALLGKRLTHLYVNLEAMNEVYALGDVLVLPSLIEGFGLVVLEAALSGLPVLVHDSPHFRWMLGPHWNSFINMVHTDQLGEKLRWSLGHLPELAAQMRSFRDELVARFDWSNLIPKYLMMYCQAASASRMTIAEQLGRC